MGKKCGRTRKRKLKIAIGMKKKAENEEVSTHRKISAVCWSIVLKLCEKDALSYSRVNKASVLHYTRTPVAKVCAKQCCTYIALQTKVCAVQNTCAMHSSTRHQFIVCSLLNAGLQLQQLLVPYTVVHGCGAIGSHNRRCTQLGSFGDEL